jgi:flagellar biosynthesis/type III secretory pathway protein FliH
MESMAREYLLRLPRRLLRVELASEKPEATPLPEPTPIPPPAAPSNAPSDDRLDQIVRWQSALQKTWQQWQEQLQELRQALPRLALELACLVWEETLGPAVPIPVEVWQRRIQELTALLSQKEGITLALHPADHEWWQKQAPEALRQMVAGWHLVPDSRLRRGEYRAQWQELAVWWQWQERLAALRQALQQRLDADAVEPGTTG